MKCNQDWWRVKDLLLKGIYDVPETDVSTSITLRILNKSRHPNFIKLLNIDLYSTVQYQINDTHQMFVCNSHFSAPFIMMKFHKNQISHLASEEEKIES